MKTKKILIRLAIVVIAVCCLCMAIVLLKNTDAPSYQSESQKTNETEAFYIVDTKKGIFHRIDCPEIKKMKTGSITLAADRETLKKQNYKECKKCDP